MNEQEKQHYKERYKEKKANGELFFPETIAKDAVVSLGLFVLLILLATLVGVPNEPPANPMDSSYIPRPEWYFMWAFQLLKYFPGSLEGVAIVGLGLAIAVGLFGLPFLDRNPKRHPLNRKVGSAVMTLIVIALVFLSIQGVATTPKPAVAETGVAADLASRVEAGNKRYLDYCAKCHGDNGEGGEIENQPGEFTRPLNDEDFLATHGSDALFTVIDYGWSSTGMPPFGIAHGGALTDQDIRLIVTFLQSWAPAEEEASGGSAADLAQLAAITNPGFAKDVKPILDKRCLSCHGKRQKGNFSVESFDKLMQTGDHKPAITPGDAANSLLIQMLRGVKTDAGGQMPPSKPLAKEQIELIERWVAQGAQNN